MITRPNLTMEDYERLEAEQFYYKRQLTSKENQYANLIERRNRLVYRINAMRRQIVVIIREIDNCEDAIKNLRDSVKMSLNEKRIWLIKLTNVKRFIHEFNEIIGQTSSPEFNMKMENIRKEHDEWMKKISRTLKDIKDLDQTLNAIRANLILHGKDLERSATADDIECSTSTLVKPNEQVK